MATKAPTSIALPEKLVERLNIKRNLLSIERMKYISMSAMIRELLEQALRANGQVVESGR